MADRAVVLFAHGARDPRWAEPLEALKERLERRGYRASLAFMELMAPDLASAVGAFVAGGERSIEIVPVFLGQGGHVREDLPRIVESVRKQHPHVDLRLAGAVGENHAVLDAIADYCAGRARD